MRALLAVITLALGLFQASASPQLVITHGGPYSGFFIAPGSDYTQSAIVVETTEPVTISCSTISTIGFGIVCCPNANITVTDCDFHYNGPPTVPYGPETKLIYVSDITQARSVTITHCRFGGPVGSAIGVEKGYYGNCALTIAFNVFYDNFNCIQIANVWYAPNINIWGNQISQGLLYYHSDQISIYASSGLPGHPISVRWNFILANPDAPQNLDSADIQIGDGNASIWDFSHDVTCEYNTCLNGSQGGIVSYYPNSNTNVIQNNTVVGVGYGKDYGFSNGIGAQPGGAVIQGNFSAWWNPTQSALCDYFGWTGIESGNTSGAVTTITLAEEKALYAQWRAQMAAFGAPYVGPFWMENQGMEWLQSSDFPQ